MKWFCDACDYQTEDKALAADHAEWSFAPIRKGKSLHVVFLREHATAPATHSMHASDAGGCYVDELAKNPKGMISSDPYRVKDA